MINCNIVINDITTFIIDFCRVTYYSIHRMHYVYDCLPFVYYTPAALICLEGGRGR